MSDAARNRAVYDAFAAAWAARDIDQLVSYLTDDVVYGASVGAEPGATYRGKVAAAEGFRHVMAHDLFGETTVGQATFCGDFGYVAWTNCGPGGTVRGFDVLEFRDGLIAVKDAYRKSRG